MAFNFPNAGREGPLTDEELEASLQAQIESSTGFYGDRVGTERAELLSIYLRHGYREDESRASRDLSTTVDSTAQDNVDHNLAELLRIFAGSEDAVTFKASNEDDVEAAKQETDIVRNVFFTQNNGYLTLQAWLWDGMVQINGFVKCWWEEKLEIKLERYMNLTEDDLTALIDDLEDDDAQVEIVESIDRSRQEVYSIEEIQADPKIQEEILNATSVAQVPGGGIQILDERFDVKIKIRQVVKGIKIKAVPPDELLISSRWESVDLTGCPFVGHRYLEEQGNLIAEGFDPEQIQNLPESEDEEFGDERTTRFDGFDLFESDDRTSVDQSTRTVSVTDCYVYVDRDGDGIAELVKARLAGADGQLLRYVDGTVAVEEIEEIELHSWTPFIIPHRHFGESVVERVQDIQRNRTVAERSMMDNFVISNNAGVIINMDLVTDDTVDDALNYRPGRVIRAQSTDAVLPMKLDATFSEALPVLEYWETRGEARSGATKLNQGLTSDSLSKNVPGVVIAQLQEAGMSKIDMIARNFAETGYTSLFKHVHALLRRHQDKELAFDVRGEWISSDPRAWGPRTTLSVGVGLGTQGKLSKINGFESILGKQMTAMQSGVPLTDGSKIYNTLVDMASALGFNNGDRYFTDPASVPPAPPPDPNADPAVAIAQAEVEVGRMGALAKLQAIQQKEAKDQRDFENKRIELEMKGHDIILKDDRERDIAVLKALVSDMGQQLSFLQSVVQPPQGPSQGANAQ